MVARAQALPNRLWAGLLSRDPVSRRRGEGAEFLCSRCSNAAQTADLRASSSISAHGLAPSWIECHLWLLSMVPLQLGCWCSCFTLGTLVQRVQLREIGTLTKEELITTLSPRLHFIFPWGDMLVTTSYLVGNLDRVLRRKGVLWLLFGQVVRYRQKRYLSYLRFSGANMGAERRFLTGRWGWMVS